VVESAVRSLLQHPRQAGRRPATWNHPHNPPPECAATGSHGGIAAIIDRPANHGRWASDVCRCHRRRMRGARTARMAAPDSPPTSGAQRRCPGHWPACETAIGAHGKALQGRYCSGAPLDAPWRGSPHERAARTPHRTLPRIHGEEAGLPRPLLRRSSRRSAPSDGNVPVPWPPRPAAAAHRSVQQMPRGGSSRLGLRAVAAAGRARFELPYQRPRPPSSGRTRLPCSSQPQPRLDRRGCSLLHLLVVTALSC
jgi:hypothetical protein